jgi:hypothetical protein
MTTPCPAPASVTAAVSAALDTQGQGVPVVVYNPLNIPREDVVEADLFKTAPKAVRVTGPDRLSFLVSHPPVQPR